MPSLLEQPVGNWWTSIPTIQVMRPTHCLAVHSEAGNVIQGLVHYSDAPHQRRRERKREGGRERGRERDLIR